MSRGKKIAAHNLWLWLPSHRAAQVVHGSKSQDMRPRLSVIMNEAKKYIEFLKGWGNGKDEVFECPCSLCQGPSFCFLCDMYDNKKRCIAIDDTPDIVDGKPDVRCPFIRGNGGFCGKQNDA